MVTLTMLSGSWSTSVSLARSAAAAMLTEAPETTEAASGLATGGSLTGSRSMLAVAAVAAWPSLT